MRETLQVHRAAIEDELPQGGQSIRGEERTWPSDRESQLEQAALQHGLHGGRDFRLVSPLAAAPGAQEDAVRYQRVLAEVTAQLAPQQVALGCGERDSGTIGSAAHRLVVAVRLTARD